MVKNMNSKLIKQVLNIILISVVFSITVNISGQSNLDVINELDVSPDGNLVATGRSNGELTVLNIITQNETILRRAGQDITTAITAIEWQPTGNLLAIGDFSGQVEIWNVDTAQLITTVPSRTGIVRTIDWFSDSNRFLVAYENDVLIWDVNVAGEVALFTIFENYGVILNADESQFISVHTRSIQWHDIVSGVLTNEIQTPDFEVEVSLSPSGNQMLVASSSIDPSGGPKLRIRDANTGAILTELLTPTGTPIGGMKEIGWSPDSSLVFTGSTFGYINVWDASTGVYLGSIESDMQIFALDIMPDGSEFVFGGVPTNGQAVGVQSAPIPNVVNDFTLINADTTLPLAGDDPILEGE
jgi:WD40 repeat protein